METNSTNQSTIETRKTLSKKQLPTHELHEGRKAVIVRSGPSKRKLDKRAGEAALDVPEELFNSTWKLTADMNWQPRESVGGPDPKLIQQLLPFAPPLQPLQEEAKCSFFRARRKPVAKNPKKRRPSQGRLVVAKPRVDSAERSRL